MSSRVLPVTGAFLIGVLVTLVAQSGKPMLGKALYRQDLQNAYVDCALSQEHAALYKAIKFGDSLRRGVENSLQVEALRCADAAIFRLKLKSFGVDDAAVQSMGMAAFLAYPELQCHKNCANVNLTPGVP